MTSLDLISRFPLLNLWLYACRFLAIALVIATIPTAAEVLMITNLKVDKTRRFYGNSTVLKAPALTVKQLLETRELILVSDYFLDVEIRTFDLKRHFTTRVDGQTSSQDLVFEEASILGTRLQITTRFETKTNGSFRRAIVEDCQLHGNRLQHEIRVQINPPRLTKTPNQDWLVVVIPVRCSN